MVGLLDFMEIQERQKILIVEQNTISEFIKKETDSIQKMLEVTKMANQKLEEYRTALITAAVTGKIDVRNFKILKSQGATHDS